MDTNPFKAAGPDGIPNIALQKAVHIIAPALFLILQASLTLGYYPKDWLIFTTITLRKPGKDDYTIPKAYRPIALEATLGKVIESVMAKRLAHLAELHNLLPATHFGGRPGRTTADALMMLTQNIKDAWRRGKVASVLFLDISQAFPTVSHQRLLHNLRMRRVPEVIVKWIESFLSDRSTTLKFDDFSSSPQKVGTGIPQGSPLSPILYLFYGSDLLELPAKANEKAGGFIDDTMFLAISDNIDSNIETLHGLLTKGLAWADRHASKFDLAKFQLVHYTRNSNKYEPTPL